jgi:hypothetical protein
VANSVELIKLALCKEKAHSYKIMHVIVYRIADNLIKWNPRTMNGFYQAPEIGLYIHKVVLIHNNLIYKAPLVS